ncbi:hypothetical protein ACFSBZ_03250 [Amnibacterium flavum]|nr:hypothetical protein [Amnibacterium flavum]
MSDAPYGEGFDKERLAALANETVTNDAVAGETVFDGLGDGNDGPTGGAPGEATPTYDENDLEYDEIVGLDDEGPVEDRS